MMHSYDALPTPYKIDDISFTLLGATFKQETGESFNFPQEAISLGLITPNGEVTNAGYCFVIKVFYGIHVLSVHIGKVKKKEKLMEMHR